MKQQYTLDDGKLIPVARPLHDRPWLVVLTLVLIGGLASSLAYYVLTDFSNKLAGVVTLAHDEYEHLLEVERTLAMTLKSNAVSNEYVLNHDQLKKIFEKVFPDVTFADERRDRYLKSVSQWSAHHSMPPLLVLSIIWRESFFDEALISKANARGPMQVMYKHHTEKLARIGKKEADLHDIDVGIRIGVEILREYFDKHDRNIFKALSAYVGGEHTRYAQDILTRYFNARIYLEEQLE